MSNRAFPPSLTEWTGTYVSIVFWEEWVILEVRERLTYWYVSLKKTHEISGDRVWCRFGDPKIIERAPNWNTEDPLGQFGTVAIKYSVEGRAFYIKRLFYQKRSYEMHPNKKNVPKNKRGKRIFRKGGNS